MRILVCFLCILILFPTVTGCMQDGIYVVPESAAETSAPDSTQTQPSADSDLLRPDPYDIAAFVLNSQEEAFLALMQEQHISSGLPALETDTTLCALAYIRARETFVLPTPESPRPAELFVQFGYTCQTSAESFSRTDGPMPLETLFANWLLYSPLAERLANPDFTRIGVGVYMKDGYLTVVCLLTD